MRKVKISKITNTPLIGIDKLIIDLINNEILDLTEFYLDNTPYSTYYMNKDNDCYLEINRKTKKLRVRGFLYNKLQYRFKMEQHDIDGILKYLIKKSNIIKTEILNTIAFNSSHAFSVEQRYNKYLHELNKESKNIESN